MDFLSHEQLIMALEVSYDGIFIFDKNARVIYANKKSLELGGMSAEVALGKTWSELSQAGYFHGNAALEALKTGRVCTSEFVNHIGCHQLCTATPIFDEDDNLVMVITNVRDISDLFELRRAIAATQAQINDLKEELGEIRHSEEKHLIFASMSMRKLVADIDRIAKTEANILLQGETGVGKSTIAERIHTTSQRKGRLVIVNCGAIPHSLCESEFFGYEKGAFTGAYSSNQGFFENADQGTILLDEIGELPLDMQVKLLRVIQSRKIRRIGGQKEIPVDVRLVAASNKNLKVMVDKGAFREDLYYRIKTITFTIPSLRDRKGDIRYLLFHFLKYFSRKYDVSKSLSPDLVAFLENYDWPGNIREMAHVMENMVVLSPGSTIDLTNIPEGFVSQNKNVPVAIRPLKEAVADTEKEILIEASRIYDNTRDMAKVLGTSHTTVARKLREYNIRGGSV